ncbi:MAG: O-antigen ligase family protein, partial [Vicinamibacterales bacterium]
DGSAQGRLEAWEASMRMAASNPLLGVGAGQFPGNFVRFARPAGGNYGRWMTAHSIYFLILGELGLPGLGLLIGFIVSNIMANRRVAREVRKLGAGEAMEVRLLQSMSASVLAYAIAGAFLSATYYPHMFVVGGLTVAARRIARLESRAGQAATPVPAKPAPTYHWAMRRAMSRGASWRTGRV